ncbi:uncharacterized protein LOC135846682 [Planococcus citri]|uniref:uncharacterized protein LOC135846682 n=1 Tax=Planococcus citri TaxID=170843 RepID=UPI0031FA38E9
MEDSRVEELMKELRELRANISSKNEMIGQLGERLRLSRKFSDMLRYNCCVTDFNRRFILPSVSEVPTNDDEWLNAYEEFSMQNSDAARAFVMAIEDNQTTVKDFGSFLMKLSRIASVLHDQMNKLGGEWNDQNEDRFLMMAVIIPDISPGNRNVVECLSEIYKRF